MCVMVPRAYSDSASGLKYRFGGILLKHPVISAEPQRLEPVEVVSDQYRFVILPPFDAPVFVYAPGDSNSLPYHGPVLAGPGCVVPPMCLNEVNITVPPVGRVPNPLSQP